LRNGNGILFKVRSINCKTAVITAVLQLQQQQLAMLLQIQTWNGIKRMMNCKTAVITAVQRFQRQLGMQLSSELIRDCLKREEHEHELQNSCNYNCGTNSDSLQCSCLFRMGIG
jgi:hypothetical protein